MESTRFHAQNIGTDNTGEVARSVSVPMLQPSLMRYLHLIPPCNHDLSRPSQKWGENFSPQVKVVRVFHRVPFISSFFVVECKESIGRIAQHVPTVAAEPDRKTQTLDLTRQRRFPSTNQRIASLSEPKKRPRPRGGEAYRQQGGQFEGEPKTRGTARTCIWERCQDAQAP